jgi:hypothetical protein
VAGDVLREVAVIAKGSKDAATVYSSNGATHRKTQLALRFVITETLEVWQHISEIVDRVDRIGTAVAALERRKSLFYAGVWEAGESYQEGDFVTDRGSLWHANRATSARPGDGSGAWTLAVKRGKDAK